VQATDKKANSGQGINSDAVEIQFSNSIPLISPDELEGFQ
jgi:hypothetical protein